MVTMRAAIWRHQQRLWIGVGVAARNEVGCPDSDVTVKYNCKMRVDLHGLLDEFL